MCATTSGFLTWVAETKLRAASCEANTFTHWSLSPALKLVLQQKSRNTLVSVRKEMVRQRAGIKVLFYGRETFWHFKEHRFFFSFLFLFLRNWIICDFCQCYYSVAATNHDHVSLGQGWFTLAYTVIGIKTHPGRSSNRKLELTPSACISKSSWKFVRSFISKGHLQWYTSSL